MELSFSLSILRIHLSQPAAVIGALFAIFPVLAYDSLPACKSGKIHLVLASVSTCACLPDHFYAWRPKTKEQNWMGDNKELLTPELWKYWPSNEPPSIWHDFIPKMSRSSFIFWVISNPL